MPIRNLPFVLAFSAVSALAQDTLSIRAAVQLGLQRNQSLEVSKAGIRSAQARTEEARAGFLPKVNYSETATRSDNPVFVFSSLLTQGQFGQSNFQIGALNHPAFLDNFQSNITAEQMVFDGGKTARAVRSAQLMSRMSVEDDREARTQVIVGVVRAYFDAVLSREALVAAQDALNSAEADLSQAERIRQTGLSTDADVLSIRVHLASVREQEIRRAADVGVAQATLNDALGLPLDTPHDLTTPLTRASVTSERTDDLERIAASRRPEQVRSSYATDIASTQLGAARASLLPKIGVRSSFEVDRQDFADRGASNWLLAASLTWNVFDGFSDKARIEEAKEAVLRAQAERKQVRSAVQLQVRRAQADLQTAEEQITVANSAVSEAEESLRITQNRYQAGLSTVTDLLRTEAALLESRTHHVSALHDQRIAAAFVDAATGTLSIDSPAVQE